MHISHRPISVLQLMYKSLITLNILVFQFTSLQVFAEEKPPQNTQVKPTSKQQEKLEIARTEYKSGLTDFKAGRYRDALKRFVRVYRLQPHPNLVYNMARSFEELKEYKNAAEYYRKYLTIAPNSEDKAQIEITITTMEKLSEEQPIQPVKPVENLLRKRVGWATAAMGTILIVGGAMFGVRALNRSEELRRFGEGDSLQLFNKVYDERNQAALLSDIFTISGVAIGSLGLYFALKPSSKQSTKRTVAISLTGNGLSIQGAF